MNGVVSLKNRWNVEIEHHKEGYSVKVGERWYGSTGEEPLPFQLQSVQGNRITVLYQEEEIELILEGFSFMLPHPSPSPKEIPIAPTQKEIKAPIAGNIIHLAVSNGVEVERGHLLCVLEAMKMENELYAPFSGKIEEVVVQTGMLVKKDQVLIRFL